MKWPSRCNCGCRCNIQIALIQMQKSQGIYSQKLGLNLFIFYHITTVSKIHENQNLLKYFSSTDIWWWMYYWIWMRSDFLRSRTHPESNICHLPKMSITVFETVNIVQSSTTVLLSMKFVDNCIRMENTNWRKVTDIPKKLYLQKR